MHIIKLYFTSVTALLLITINLQAVVVSWQNGVNFSTAANDVNTTGSLVEARNYGTILSYNVSGINFVGVSENGEFSNNLGGFLGTPLADTNYSNLLNTAAYNPTTSANINFTGLTIGHDYLVQLWYADTRGAIPPRSSTIISDLGGPDQASSNFSKTQFIVGTFTADSNNISLNLEIDGGLGSQLNAAQLRLIGVPETQTYALIFGGLSLGMVLMMRRQRSKNLN